MSEEGSRVFKKFDSVKDDKTKSTKGSKQDNQALTADKKTHAADNQTRAADNQTHADDKRKFTTEEQITTQKAKEMGYEAAKNAEQKNHYEKVVENAEKAHKELEDSTKVLEEKSKKVTDENAQKDLEGVLTKREKILRLREEQISYEKEAKKNGVPKDEIEKTMREYDLRIKEAEEEYISSSDEFIKTHRNVVPNEIIDLMEKEIQKSYERINNINANLLGMGYRDSRTNEYMNEIMKIIEYQISIDKKNREKTIEEIQKEIDDKREYIRDSISKGSSAYNSDKETAGEIITSTYEYDHGYSHDVTNAINSAITLGIISNIEEESVREEKLKKYEDSTYYGSGKNIKEKYFMENTFSHTHTE